MYSIIIKEKRIIDKMETIVSINEIKQIPVITTSLYIFDFDETLFLTIGDTSFPMNTGDIDFINKLHKHSTIMILTARNIRMKKETINILKAYNVKYEYLFFDQNKGDLVKKFLHIQRSYGSLDGYKLFKNVFFIDDLIENCRDVSTKNQGVKCYLIKPNYHYIGGYFSQ